MKHNYSSTFLHYLLNEAELTSEEIEHMSRAEILEEVLNCEGLLHHTCKIKRIIKDIYGINLDQLEENHRMGK